jgi:hypothetical protein
MSSDLELPQALADELAPLADAQGCSVDTLVTRVLTEHLPELRAGAERDVPFAAAPNVSNLHPDREARERAALCARAFVILNRDYDLNWPPEPLQQVASIPPSYFVVANHRGLAVQLDMCGELDAASVDVPLVRPASVPRPGDVLRAMEVKLCELIVEFRVYGRVPMPGDIECEPFGDISKLVLVSGLNPLYDDSYSPELIAVRVHVPVRDYDERVRRVPINNDDAIDVSSAWTTARYGLEHVLNTLRLMQVRIVHSDHRGSHGVPFRSWLGLEFADKTTRRTENTRYGWHMSVASGPTVVTTPLKVARDLFRQTYEEAATEIALFGDSRLLRAVDVLRQLLLVVESTHAKPEHGIPGKEMSEFEAALRERPFIARLERLRAAGPRWFAPFPDNLALASELAQLRHSVCHLQVREFRGAKVKLRKDRFGIDPYDPDLLERIERAIPIARAVAHQIISELVAPHMLEDFRARRTPVRELINLRRSPTYARNARVSEILARHALGQWHDGDRDPYIASLIIELLASAQTQDLAKSFAQAAIELPETHAALIDAIQRNDADFALHVIKVVSLAAPHMLADLKTAASAAKRDDIVELLAASTRVGQT